MGSLAARGWRVLGYFVWMLGAGIVLDSEAWTAGAVLCVGGLLLFALGLHREKPRAAEVP